MAVRVSGDFADCDCIDSGPVPCGAGPVAFGVMFGFEIGFDWVCFFAVRDRAFFHNPCVYKMLGSFWLFGNWVCFA